MNVIGVARIVPEAVNVSLWSLKMYVGSVVMTVHVPTVEPVTVDRVTTPIVVATQRTSIDELSELGVAESVTSVPCRFIARMCLFILQLCKDNGRRQCRERHQ